MPLITRTSHPRKTESALKYFIIQELAATTVLFSAVINAWATGEWVLENITDPIAAHICFLALALKIGLAPLHNWLPDALQGQDFTTGLILATWQKLAPFALLTILAPNLSSLSVLIGLMSIIVGAWGGINQNQVRKLLGYSSIAHMGWIILVLEFKPSLTTLALTLYITTSISLFTIFMMEKSKTLNALATAWTKNAILTAITPLIILSLAGLPPLTGFIPKWFIIHELTMQDLPLLASLAILSSLLSLFFYVRVLHTLGMTLSPGISTKKTPWRRKKFLGALPLATTTIVTTVLLPTATILLASFNV